MNDRGYSPRLRTGVVLSGVGTAGAYQAGALKALAEAGIRIDVIAGHGPGALNALAAAIDGGARLWSESSPWRAPGLRRAYVWRPSLRAAALGMFAALALLLTPLLLLLAAALLYVLASLASYANLASIAERAILWYTQVIEWAFSPPILPTVVPRAVVLTLLIVAAVLASAAWHARRSERSRRRFIGAFWWRLLGVPLDAREPGRIGRDLLWHLVRGASDAATPTPDVVGRQFADLLTDNLGQPGFSEVVVAVHDLDARRDLVAAVVRPERREALAARRKVDAPREAEILDLTGAHQGMLLDLVAAAFRLPVVTPAVEATFPADSYWQGETHRLCDRPETVARLVEEVAALGVEQVVVVSAAAPAASPHGIRVQPGDLRSKVGEFVRSLETAALDAALSVAAARMRGVFVVRPRHNAVMPFAFDGTYDESSDRRRTLVDLMEQGYRDAYAQFIEPAVAGGDPHMAPLEAREIR